MSEEEQEQVNEQAMYYNPNERTLPYQLESGQIIEEIEHILKGETKRFNPKTGDYEFVKDKVRRRLINDKGVGVILAILHSHLNKTFILSDLEEEQINNITEGLSNDLVDSIFFNFDEFQIPDTACASIVVDIVVNTVYATLRKATRGGYLNFLRTIQRTQDIQTYTENQKTKTGGLRSLIMPGSNS